MGEVFAHEDELPLAIFVVLGDRIESIVDSSLSCEESGRILIWDFQYDSYVSVSCRFGLLDFYWVPSSTRVAFLMVDCFFIDILDATHTCTEHTCRGL